MDAQIPPVFYRTSSPFGGRCPAYMRATIKQRTKQGKGTIDHLLPLGDWFLLPGPDKPLWAQASLVLVQASYWLAGAL